MGTIFKEHLIRILTLEVVSMYKHHGKARYNLKVTSTNFPHVYGIKPFINIIIQQHTQSNIYSTIQNSNQYESPLQLPSSHRFDQWFKDLVNKDLRRQLLYYETLIRAC